MCLLERQMLRKWMRSENKMTTMASHCVDFIWEEVVHGEWTVGSFTQEYQMVSYSLLCYVYKLSFIIFLLTGLQFWLPQICFCLDNIWLVRDKPCFILTTYQQILILHMCNRHKHWGLPIGDTDSLHLMSNFFVVMSDKAGLFFWHKIILIKCSSLL